MLSPTPDTPVRVGGRRRHWVPAMSEPTSLGLLLKRYRMAAGLSQEALAQRAELSARAISDLERGLHRAPHAATLDLLATALALSSHQRALLLTAARPELAEMPLASDRAFATTAPRGLPTPPTPLIGREAESAHALALLRGAARLVTLTGPSGVGKTRLALQIGREIAGGFPDGAVFVDLAPVREAARVPGALARALHLREQGDDPLDQQVRTYLRDRRMLLLLDNCEQVVAAAPFVADLLAWCPQVVFLATSRIPLHLRGEQTLPLAPLALEDAIALFRERARAVRPDAPFVVTEMAAICERVDCLPLAIELIAAQVAMLPLPQILDQLNQRAPLAMEGARDLPARQRTLEAAIGWSYDLLTADQQRCFRALAIFVGGFTLVSARAVCWDADEDVTEAEALVTLAALVDASLIRVVIAPEGYARFQMLRVVREYALDRLRAAGEAEEEERRRQHAAFFAAQADALMSTGFGAAPAQLILELPNARAALEWAAERRDAALGLRLAGFARLWQVRGATGEAIHWQVAMLALDAEARVAGAPTAPITVRVMHLYGYARTLLNHGEFAAAEARARESAALARAEAPDDADGLSNAYATLGMIAQARGDLDQAAAAFTESVAYAGPDARSEARYRALYSLGELARNQGDLDRAHPLLHQALAGAEAAGNAWDSAIMTTVLAHLERQRGAFAQARSRYLDGLARFHAFGSPTFFAWCLEGYSALLSMEGAHAQAVRFCAAAATLRERAYTPLPASERAAFEETLAQAREALGEEAYAAERAAGTALTEAAILTEVSTRV